MLKKFIRLGAVLVSAAVLLAGCSGGKPAGTEGAASSSGDSDGDYVLKIGYNNSLCEAPIQMGVEKGFFEAEGLKFEMVKADAAHMPEAIGSGQIEAGFGLLGKYLQPIDNGLDIKITAGIHTGCTKLLVPRDSDINTVSDLKGKRVGTGGLGAAGTITTRRSLYHAGLNASPNECDVEFVVYSESDLAQALQNNAVDAIVLGDPKASIAEKDYNLKCIIDTARDEEYRDEYCCISFVTGKLAQEHPEIAEKFTKAIMKSAQWVENNKEETARIQVEKEWVAGDPEFNSQVLSAYNYLPSLEGGLEALKITVPDLQAIGLINGDKNAEEFIGNAFFRLENLSDESVLGEANEINLTEKTDGITQVSYEAATNIMPDCCGGY